MGGGALRVAQHDGAGLGIQFLKHLQRTKLLLHLVDIAPLDVDADPAVAFKSISNELGKYSKELDDKPRWLVINKTDLLTAEDMAVAQDDLLEKLDWNGPVFAVSAESGAGTEALGQAVMRELELIDEMALADGAEDKFPVGTELK